MMLAITPPNTPPPSKEQLALLSEKQIAAALECVNAPYARVVSEFLNLNSNLVFFDKRLFLHPDHCRWWWLLYYYAGCDLSYQYDTDRVGYLVGKRNLIVLCGAHEKEEIIAKFRADPDRNYHLGFVWGHPNRDRKYEFHPCNKGKPSLIPLWGIENYLKHDRTPTASGYHGFGKGKQAMADGTSALKRIQFVPADQI